VMSVVTGLFFCVLRLLALVEKFTDDDEFTFHYNQKIGMSKHEFGTWEQPLTKMCPV
jgi:hypothetical protein